MMITTPSGSSSSSGSGLFCEASLWSYVPGVAGSESATTEEDRKDDLVSPIVNREIEVSVKAPWPSSSTHSVLCEA
eukprot:CAMPEP_0172358516 /NCGR_PEP_ID=MMETSP1060-20121228/2824_1 /TAXON_ID=37318 /ORGANISM="Pseudo-nitzschia pungens, Strain cf. cingulata" /LENGTH=75 /DNA_ID=CAMNT_0013079761 /DNA_START=175 /DNA_END=398 /DNA_ORIENTATION=-